MRRHKVGLSIQLAVIEDREEYHKEVAEEQLRERERRPVPFHVIINPKFTHLGSDQAEFFEGCLSVSGFSVRSLAERAPCEWNA